MLNTFLDIEKDKLVFLNTIIDSTESKLYLKMYNTKDKKLYRVEDRSGFKPFFYVKKDEVDPIVLQKFLEKYKGSFEIQSVELYDGIQDKQIQVYKFIASNIFTAYKKYTQELGIKYQYEYQIKYYESYCLSNQLVPCGLYYIENGMLYEYENKLSPRAVKMMESLMSDQSFGNQEYRHELAKSTLDLSQEVPDIPRCAIDIEVAGKENQIPDVKTAEYPITMCSFYDNNGFKEVIADGRYYKYSDDFKDPEIKIVMALDEQDLIKQIFWRMNSYPIILTYNGDDFDLPYIAQRSKVLGMDQTNNPILFSADNLEKRNSFRKDPCFLKNSIHLDLYRLFSNKSLHTYGFNRKYQQFKLNDVASALLGEGKIEHDKFSEMTLKEMAVYCQKDSELTLRLTTYNDNLVMKLLFAVCRTTKASIEDVTRYGISNWVRSMLFFEHRKNNMLIPHYDELRLKTIGIKSADQVDTQRFEGGFVLDPTPGSHFNVVVMDFASLYPSIIKTRNLSYETINCKHNYCHENNKVPETVNWYCTKRQGMLSLIIGVMRDLRVEYFKKLSKDKSLSEDERDLYDSITQAEKVILNGTYGVIGQEVFQLFCLPVAESITAFGRSIIKDTKKFAEETLGLKVLYGDTDSIFIHNPTKEHLDKLIERTKQVHGIDIESDKTYRYVILSKRKKNYFGIHSDGKIETKGLTAKKSNIPPLVKQCYDKSAEIFSKVNNKEELDAAIKAVKELVRDYVTDIRRGNYDIKDLAISIKLARDVDSYGTSEESEDLLGNRIITRKRLPEHVRVVEQLQSQGHIINKGDFVSYIKGIKGPMIITEAKKDKVDKEKYIDSFRTALKPIFEPLDIDFDDVVDGSHKDTTLADMWK